LRTVTFAEGCCSAASRTAAGSASCGLARLCRVWACGLDLYRYGDIEEDTAPL
jgi:hypothetical protein